MHSPLILRQFQTSINHFILYINPDYHVKDVNVKIFALRKYVNSEKDSFGFSIKKSLTGFLCSTKIRFVLPLLMPVTH